MTVLRVFTLNVGSLLEGGWEERRQEVVSWIDYLAPDVVCLQEIWESAESPNTGRWVAEHAEVDWHVSFGGDSFAPGLWPDSTLRFGSAVLSRWPIEEMQYHRLPVRDDADGTVAGVPWELVHVRTAGLDVFSTHLAAAPTDALHRQRQVMAIDRIVRTARGSADDLAGFGVKRTTMPPILCGDFNAEPDSDEIRWLTSLTSLPDDEGIEQVTFWQDAWRVAGDGSEGFTQDWAIAPLAAELNVHRKRIDYVFVGDPFMRADDAGRVLDARVVGNEARTGVIASDHFGVYADVAWPQRPNTPRPNTPRPNTPRPNTQRPD